MALFSKQLIKMSDQSTPKSLQKSGPGKLQFTIKNYL